MENPESPKQTMVIWRDHALVALGNTIRCYDLRSTVLNATSLDAGDLDSLPYSVSLASSYW